MACAFARRQMGENFLLVALFEAFDDVGRIVRVELRYGLGQNLVRQGFGDLVADALVELGQNLVIKGRADRLDELDALFRLEEFDDVGKIGRLEIAHELSGAPRSRYRPSASEMARIRSGDGVPSRLGRRLNVAVFSQKEVLVRLAVGPKRLSDRGRRSLQPAPIASEIVAGSRVVVVLISNNRQTLRLLSNSLGRWPWNLFDRSLNGVLTLANARRRIQLIARFTAFRNRRKHFRLQTSCSS